MTGKGAIEMAKGDKAGQPTRAWQFSKTKMCKFNLIGMCAKGEQCQFAHAAPELRSLPDLSCTKLCPTLIQTGSCDRKGCNYAHAKDELRMTSTFHKTKMCRFSQQGHCALGAKCNFAHDPSELRPDPVATGGSESKVPSLSQLPSFPAVVPKASMMSPQFLPMPSALGCVEPLELSAAAPEPPDPVMHGITLQGVKMQRKPLRVRKAARRAKEAAEVDEHMAALGSLDGYSAYMAQLAGLGWNGLPDSPGDALGDMPFPDIGSMFPMDPRNPWYDGDASSDLESQLALLSGWDLAGSDDAYTDNYIDEVWHVKNTFLTLDEQAKPLRSVRTAEGALCFLGGDLEIEN